MDRESKLARGVEEHFDTDHLAGLEFSMLVGQGKRRRGKRHGPWQFRDDAGTLRAAGKFHEGVEQGEFRYWNSAGELTQQTTWRDGKKVATATWEEGQLVRRWRLDGTVEFGEEFFPTGRPSVITRRDGGVISTTAFYATGHRKAEYTTDAEGRSVGLSRNWDVGGSLRNESRHPKRGDVATKIRWWSDGFISAIGEQLDGKMHGRASNIRHDGVEAARFDWVNGDAHGICRVWAPDGRRFTWRAKRGNRHGIGRAYYANGVKRWQGRWVDGQLDGLVQAFHENGALEREGEFAHGVMIGTWHYYESDGSERACLRFGDGTRAGIVLTGSRIALRGKQRVLRTRAEIEAFVSVDGGTGRLAVDEHRHIAALGDADDLQRLAAEEREALIEGLWPDGDAPRGIANPDGRFVGKEIEVAGSRARLVRTPTGLISVQRHNTERDRWETVARIGDGVVRPQIVLCRPAPSQPRLALVIDADGREKHASLLVVDVARGSVELDKESIPFPGHESTPTVWNARNELFFVSYHEKDKEALTRWTPATRDVVRVGKGITMKTPVTPKDSDPSVALVHFGESDSVEVLQLDSAEVHLAHVSFDWPVRLIEQDGWLTMTTGHRHVVAATLPDGVRRNDWQLIDSARRGRQIRAARWDGQSLETAESRRGRIAIRTRVASITSFCDHPAVADHYWALPNDGGTPESRVTSLHATAPDGERIAMSAYLPEGHRVNGVLLMTYGGFDSLAPAPHEAARAELHRKGIAVVVAHVRGGGERGHAGVVGGTGPDALQPAIDLAACAEALVDTVAPARSIVLHGGSHGGFVVAHAAPRAGGSVAGVVMNVPLLDLHASSWLGPYAPWTDERVIARDYRADISPYATMPKEIDYDILATCGTSDSRVPWHDAVRYVRRARERMVGGAQGHVWIEVGVGHCLEDGRYRRMRERAILRFIERAIERAVDESAA